MIIRLSSFFSLALVPMLCEPVITTDVAKGIEDNDLAVDHSHAFALQFRYPILKLVLDRGRNQSVGAAS